MPKKGQKIGRNRGKIKYCRYCGKRMRSHQTAHVKCIQQRHYESINLGNADLMSEAATRAIESLRESLAVRVIHHDCREMPEAEVLEKFGLQKISALPKRSVFPWIERR